MRVFSAAAGATMVGAATTHVSEEVHVAPAGQSAVCVHRAHEFVARLQAGVAAAQSLLARHPATTVNDTAALEVLVTKVAPAPTEAVATALWLPSAKSVNSVTCQFPAPSVVARTSMETSICKRICEEGGAVPTNAVRRTLLVVPDAGAVMVGAARPQTLFVQVAPATQSRLPRHATQTPLPVSQRRFIEQSPSTRQPPTNVKVIAALAALCAAVTPEPTVAVNVTLWVPSANVTGDGKAHKPFPSAMTLPIETASTATATLAPATAVPVNVGAGLFNVVPLPGDVRLGADSTHALAEQVAPAGQSAFCVQRTQVFKAPLHTGVAAAHSELAMQPETRVKDTVALAGLVTNPAPAPTKAVALAVWLPKVRAIDKVICQFPAPSTAANSSVVPSIWSRTSEEGGAVPENTGRNTLLVVPETGVAIFGAGNTQALPEQVAPVVQSELLRQSTHRPLLVSHRRFDAQSLSTRQPPTSVKLTGALMALCTLCAPAPTVAASVTEWVPTAKADADAKDHIPFESAMTVPTSVESTMTATLAPTTAVPV